MTSERVTKAVDVPGGALAVELHPTESAPVLAVHGVSSNCRLWNWLHAEAPELSLITPDLRGRADSFEVTGPYSIRQHAEDMVRVLDALGLDTVDVCGMSMGGFVAVELATLRPDRVRSLVLVDGGMPMGRPPGLTKEKLSQAFAGQLSRLDQAFGGVDEYRDHYLKGAPLLDPADPLLLDYLGHDLGPDGRVRLSGTALLDDSGDVFFGEAHWTELTVPTWLLCAEWSRGEGTPPAYSDRALAVFQEKVPVLRTPHRLPGTDHAATIMTRGGAAATAAALRAAQS